MVTSFTAELLAVLTEQGGFTTGRVSKAAKISYCSDNARARSGAVRAALDNLKVMGLVDFLDDQKPVCWVRTPAGTAALEEYALKNLRSLA